MAPSETAMIAGDLSASPAETMAWRISRLLILKAPTETIAKSADR